MTTRYFEDLAVGDVFDGADLTLSEAQIVAFARDYDPQPMHLDPDWARTGPHGAVIASGFQTVALAFRLFYDLGVIRESSIIGIGLDEVRWHAPVKAGERVRARAEVVERRESRSRSDRGLVTWRFSLLNDADETLVSYKDISLIRKRPG